MTTTSEPSARVVPPAPLGRMAAGRALQRDSLGVSHELWRRHGDVVRLDVGPKQFGLTMFVFSSPEAAATIFGGSTWRAFEKNDNVYNEIRAWLGDGLLSAQGEEWTRQRRFVQPVFTHAAVDGYTDLMVREIDEVLAELPRTGDASADEGVVIDLGDTMMALTLRVVVRALFGEAGTDVIETVREAFPELSETVIRRGLSPAAPPRGWPTPRLRRARAAQDRLWALCDRIIAERRSAGNFEAGDLLGRLIAARDGGKSLSDTEIRDQVLIFLLAGHETTSTALTYTLHLLGRHTEVQDRVRAEVTAALGNRTPTAADAAALTFTTACLKEGMRLYPSAPIVGRIATEDTTVCGVDVPAGATVVSVIRNVHRHPDHWPDPLTYEPHRFLDGADKRRHRYAWMPFGGGPRACVGQYFSITEAVLVVALLLRDHEVEAMADADDLPVRTFITMVPSEPVHVRLTPRR